MNKFKALLKKDIIVDKKTLLMPIWITAGAYILILIISLIGFYKIGVHSGEFHDIISNIDININDYRFSEAVNYIANYTILQFPALLFLIFVIMLSQKALNEEKAKKCLVFHRSQPVSIWEICFSKYAVAIFGNWVILFFISVVLFIFVNIIIAINFDFIFNIAASALIKVHINAIKTGLVIGSILFFFSAIFKDKVFWKVLALIIGINILISIMNFVFGYHLTLPLNYLFKLISPSSFYISSEKMNNINNFAYFCSINWKDLLFNMNVLIKIVVSAILFIGGTLIYKYKEIK